MTENSHMNRVCATTVNAPLLMNKNIFMDLQYNGSMKLLSQGIVWKTSF